jgi:quinol monooxygenase YgiN
MPEVTVIATLTAKEYAANELKALALRLIEATRKEDGCLEYLLHSDNNNPNSFVFYERWASAEHLKRHTESPHFTEIVPKFENLTEQSSLQELSRLPA